MTDHCHWCNDTGWIVVRNTFRASYVGPGPCPDDARGVVETRCDHQTPLSERDEP